MLSIEKDMIKQLNYLNLINIYASKIAKQIALGNPLKHFDLVT